MNYTCFSFEIVYLLYFADLTSPKPCPCCCTQQTSATRPKVGTSTTAGPPPYWRSSSDRWVGFPGRSQSESWVAGLVKIWGSDACRENMYFLASHLHKWDRLYTWLTVCEVDIYDSPAINLIFCPLSLFYGDGGRIIMRKTSLKFSLTQFECNTENEITMILVNDYFDMVLCQITFHQWDMKSYS